MFRLRKKAEESIIDCDALMLRAEALAAETMRGHHHQRKPGSGEQFWQFRDYSHSDEPRMIDWRQSAKGSRVFVKEKELETAQKYLFWLAHDAGMFFQSSDRLGTKYEAGAVLMLALSLILTRNGERVGALEGGKAGTGEAAIERLQHMIENQSVIDHMPEDTRNASLPLMNHQVPRHSSLVLVGDFLSPIDDIAAGFEDLAAVSQNGIVFHILDPAEIDLPYDGRVEFESPGGSFKTQINHVGSVRADYQKRLQHHLDAVRALCEDYGWVYLLYRTDHDLKDPLQALFERVVR